MMTTAKERAERALRHAPFVGRGREAVLPFVEQEIVEAEQAERERCAVKCDEIEARWRVHAEEHDLAVDHGRRDGAMWCADAIRGLEADD